MPSATSLHIAVIMDPLDRVDIDKDTTFVLMLEAQARGHEVLYTRAEELYLKGGKVWARLWPIRLERSEDFYRLGPAKELQLDSLDAVLMRKDPPYTMDYFYAAHLLSLVRGAFVMNSGHGLREANEKLFALRFTEVTPPSLVTKEARRILEFLDELRGEAIVKPLDGCGGGGVFHLRRDDTNLTSLLETSTKEGTEYVLVQKYLPEVRQGDKRVIVLDGEPLGAVLRVPRANEARSNIHVGGEAVKAVVTPRDREICETLKPSFQQLGLWFVGLDVIGDWLTEVN
ncbi:MAG: glutathione synthase, partial [Deltaproteobacteria bacterium]|nr:glutathione synthase [Deltaproteobacteria bacterium]